jgi:hypothetical protein
MTVHYFAVCLEGGTQGDDAAQSANYWAVEVAVVEAAAEGTIEAAAGRGEGVLSFVAWMTTGVDPVVLVGRDHGGS